MREYQEKLQIIFQDPLKSLNSRHTVEKILSEPFEIHGIGNKEEKKIKIKSLLAKVGLPEDSINKYPHEFSGGQAKDRHG